MTGPETAFLLAASMLWALLFVYPLGLLAAYRRRHDVPVLEEAELPSVSVVVATLDEAARVADRLRDLERAEYPADRVEVLVADGGSTDGTREAFDAAAKRRARWIDAPRGRGKAAQVAAGIAAARGEIVVVSDVDVRLAPDALRKLVETLRHEPSTGLVGARIEPATGYAVERLHWILAGRLGWLEGEVLGAGIPSGVALAFRRGQIELDPTAASDDAFLAFDAARRGLDVRTRIDAVATELRTPADSGELLGVRRRRGRDYLRDLRLSVRRPGAGPGFRLARRMRLLLTLVAPWLALAVGLAGLALSLRGSWVLPAATAAAFSTTLLGLAAACPEWRSRPAPFAVLRWAGLTLVATAMARLALLGLRERA